VARNSASPSAEERKRLIEEGRRLLQLSRGGPTPTASHRYPLRSAATTAVKEASDAALLAESARSATIAALPSLSPTTRRQPDLSEPAATHTPIGTTSEWDFDDEDLDEASTEENGWDFDEDLT
jgi:hypothetical protein